MPASIFTKIYNGEVPGYILHKDATSFAILDVNPLAPGHTLVIPTREVGTLQELSREEITALFLTVQKITGILDSVLAPDGYTIGINQGVGQGVPHVHVHVIPRQHDDGGGNLHTILTTPPSESVESVFNRINEKST